MIVTCNGNSQSLNCGSSATISGLSSGRSYTISFNCTEDQLIHKNNKVSQKRILMEINVTPVSRTLNKKVLKID